MNNSGRSADPGPWHRRHRRRQEGELSTSPISSGALTSQRCFCWGSVTPASGQGTFPSFMCGQSVEPTSSLRGFLRVPFPSEFTDFKWETEETFLS